MQWLIELKVNSMSTCSIPLSVQLLLVTWSLLPLIPLQPRQVDPPWTTSTGDHQSSPVLGVDPCDTDIICSSTRNCRALDNSSSGSACCCPRLCSSWLQQQHLYQQLVKQMRWGTLPFNFDKVVIIICRSRSRSSSLTYLHGCSRGGHSSA